MTPAGRRRKGDRVERMLVEAHVSNRIPAKRVPLSGAQPGWEGDILIADRLRAEVKARRAGQGFKVILRWMGDNDLLFLRMDRTPPLVVMDWDLYLRMMEAWLGERGELCSPEPASES